MRSALTAPAPALSPRATTPRPLVPPARWPIEVDLHSPRCAADDSPSSWSPSSPALTLTLMSVGTNSPRQFECWESRQLPATPPPRPTSGFTPGRARKAAPTAALLRLPATSAASLQEPECIEKKSGQSLSMQLSASTTTYSPWKPLASQSSALRPQSARLSGAAEGGFSPTRPTSGRARPQSSRAKPLSPGGSLPRKQPPPTYARVWPRSDTLTVRSPARGGTSPGLAFDLATIANAPSVQASHALSPRRATSGTPAALVNSPSPLRAVPHAGSFVLDWRSPGEAVRPPAITGTR